MGIVNCTLNIIVIKQVGEQISKRYPIIRHTQGQDSPDSINKVVKYNFISSKNPQNKNEGDYYLKVVKLNNNCGHVQLARYMHAWCVVLFSV